MFRSLTVSLGLLVAFAGFAHAQNTIGAQGQSVTVQLPTFSFFTVSTTVVVPDSGGAYAGGIKRGGSSLVSSPLNRGRGVNRGAASVSVHAWIHDFASMDEAILAEAARKQAGDDDDLVLTGPAAPSQPPLSSVAAIQQRQAAANRAEQQEVQEYLEKARGFETEGKPGVAKIYYQMAWRRAEGELKSLIGARIRALNAPQVARRP